MTKYKDGESVLAVWGLAGFTRFARKVNEVCGETSKFTSFSFGVCLVSCDASTFFQHLHYIKLDRRVTGRQKE